ncbi:MAG: AAA-like domain-containing protein [Xenococcaceae cyanobacterium MO_167.B52]|nr:AAA-like domain-containing protein [Xenococcaceae cyanobacterium MO_167.B52]
MTFDSLLNFLDQQFIEIDESPLNAAERLLLKGILKDLSYTQISRKEGYSSAYLTNVAAPKLYKKLSKLFGKNVTKKNCRLLIESKIEVKSSILPTYPGGAVPLDSPFYIERPPIEEQVYEEISKPGALIRIKAPKEMGKTSLLVRILNHAVNQGYRTVTINFEQIDCAILSDLDRFLRFLCASATQQLNLESKLEDYWDDDIGSKVSCSLYFRCYLLEQIKSPLVLAFDELNQIFEYPQVAKDLLPLFRSWYEDAKITPIWQKLRLIVVHSTEVYIPLQIYQSPFNVGLPIQLKSFEFDQVNKLAKKYQLDWQSGKEVEQLINLVGGHPALIQIALYHLSRQEITLAKLLQTALTPEGIYHRHLRRQWLTLQQEPELAEFFNLLLQTNRPVQLKPIVAYKLSSMGLIKQIGNEAIVSCKLYQDYFTKNFIEMDSPTQL